jgi:hypothetical protein
MRPAWVVCHQVTRSAAGLLVRCPQRGQVLSEDCLRCRFLTTSSVERSVGPWCEAGPAEMVRAAEPPGQELPAAAPPPSPPDRRRPISPLDLPILVPVGPGIRVAEPAVRTTAAVPSAQAIGT